MTADEAFEPPDLAMVRAWVGVPVSSLSDGQLQGIIDAELGAQAAVCKVDPWQPELTQTLYRRVGREIAAMGLPLGVIAPDSEYGGASLPRFDSEIERLERPYRNVVLS